jgi:hypothetical protein
MRAYYGFTKKGNAFVYIPYHLAGISLNMLNFRFRFDLSFLERLDKSLKNRKPDFLEKIGWDTEEVEVNEHYLRAFREFLYKYTKEKIKEKAYEITELVAGLAGNKRNRSLEKSYEYMENYPYDIEDYEDDWWKRGEKSSY